VFADGPSPLECAAKGCRAPAAPQLRWNNPQLHTPEYRKVWFACAEPLAWLRDFLGARGFLRETTLLPSARAAAAEGRPDGDAQAG